MPAKSEGKSEVFPFGYRLFGLQVAANRPLPEVAPLAAGDWPVVDLHLAFLEDAPIPAHYGALPWRLLHEQRGPTLIKRMWAASTPAGFAHRFCLTYLEKYLDVIATPPAAQEPGRVEVYWQNSSYPPDERWQDIAAYIFDVVLSYIARWRIPAVLHGSALTPLLDRRGAGSVFALIGPSGAGKSTLTAAFLSAGYAMLADDHVALWPRQEHFWVEPGLPRMRLWPSSVAVINDTQEELPRVYSFLEKRLKILPTGEGAQESRARFQPSALPLGALYLLAPRDPQLTQVKIERLAHKRALQELWARRDTSLSLSSQQSAAELALLAQVAQQLPIYRVHRPDSLQSLPQVVEAIAATLDEIAPVIA